jgi:acyl-CoA synthetase (AMP-forming)/AMP-acid ligase II
VEFCREHLARFKVPKRVLFTHELPYSPYGKVMKEALKKEYLD